jgi:hypothetical protein
MSCELIALRLRFGRSWVMRLEDGMLQAIAGPNMTVLRAPIELHGDDLKSVETFVVSEAVRPHP